MTCTSTNQIVKTLLEAAANAPVDAYSSHKQPLYIERRVLNPHGLVKWAMKYGFIDALGDPGKLHVTQAYSSTPVDWGKIAGDNRKLTLRNDRRTITQFNDTTFVLEVTSNQLQRRFEKLRRLGCSWDFPTYRPHITLTSEQADLSQVDWDVVRQNIYNEEIIFGPERFDEIRA